MVKLEMADMLWITAEATIKMAEKAGKKIKMSDVYNKETVKALALASAYMRSVIEIAINEKIEVIS